MFRVALIPRGCLRDGGKRNKQCGRGGMLHSQSLGDKGHCVGGAEAEGTVSSILTLIQAVTEC